MLFPNGVYLMSSPEDAYDVCYKINPWMEPEKKLVDTSKANSQWNELRDTVARLGARATIVKTPNADGVFAANAGFVWDRQFVLSTFRHEERQAEEPYWLNWARSVIHPNNPFEKLFQKVHLLNTVPFEGRGDALRVEDLIVCGYGFRTDFKATSLLQETLGVPVIPVELKNEKFYHLDTVFCPLKGRQVLFYPGGFKEPNIIRENFDAIEVGQPDAYKFACNSILIGDTVVVPEGCDHTCRILRLAGYEACQVPVGEFIKSGGACHCLVLRYF